MVHWKKFSNGSSMQHIQPSAQALYSFGMTRLGGEICCELG